MELPVELRHSSGVWGVSGRYTIATKAFKRQHSRTRAGYKRRGPPSGVTSRAYAAVKMLLYNALDHRVEATSGRELNEHPEAVATVPSCRIVLEVLDNLHLYCETTLTMTCVSWPWDDRRRPSTTPDLEGWCQAVSMQVRPCSQLIVRAVTPYTDV